MDDLDRQRELRRLRDEVLSTPNCLRCVQRMEPAEVDGEPIWQCPECGATRSA
ncbi:zf-TFIIB domain-containing protein [Microbacterium esteraromaticum]|uniref:zf-TFIIB domain-containing protein n=1 Tax=Microbacterium esteraromaticum TaxID=57043 RepID=UPI003B83242D